MSVLVFDNKNIDAVKVFDSEVYQSPRFEDINGDVYPGFEEYKASVPSFYVFSIHRGKCVVGGQDVFTSDNQVITGIASQEESNSVRNSTKISRNFLSIKGSVVNLSLSGLENNYYHFLVEFLARLYLLTKSKIQPDYYIFPQLTKFQREFIDLRGIDETRILRLEKGQVIQADALIVPSLINNWECIDFRDYMHYQKQWLPSWTSQLYRPFIPANSLAEKQIYITRKKAKYRCVENEDALVNVLSQYGFQSYELESLSVAEQISLFNSASFIIAPHGAGLVNMSFCRSGVNILELYSENYHDASFRIQANILGHNYNYLVGKTKKKRVFRPQVEDMVVDIAAVENFLQKLIC